MRFEEREDGIVIVCGNCRRAVARLTDKGVRIEPRHGHNAHPTTLSPADLRQLAEISERMAGSVLR